MALAWLANLRLLPGKLAGDYPVPWSGEESMTARAFIFDMDGTLVDSEVLWVEATATFLRQQGCTLSHAEGVALVYGHAWDDIYVDIRARFPALDMDRVALEDQLHEIFLGLRDVRDVRIVTSVDLLKKLAQDHPVCVVSGSPRRELDESIALAGVGPHLAFALASEDYHPGKPHPACFRMAADKLGVPPEACLVFEDSAAGITAAKAAGMQAIALVRPNAPKQDMSAADAVMTDLAEFEIGA